MKRFQDLAAAVRHHIRTDGIYDFPDHSSDVHVSISPHQYYQEYNKDLPPLGWFIPAGFYESEADYKTRSDHIRDYTKDWTFAEVKNLVKTFWIPRTSYRSFQQFIANQIIPRMTLLNPTKTTIDENKRDFIIGWLIDIGWDPLQSYYCEPPVEPTNDIKYIVDAVWQMFNHSTYPEIKIEYMKLFRINEHRIIQFIDMIDGSIVESPKDNIEHFIIEREKKMIAHLAWLVKTHSEVYDVFKKRVFRQIDHNIAMSMYINDPLMSEEQRLKRDLMLITHNGKKNVDPYRDEGHNRIRDSIMEEHIPAYDHEETKRGIFNYYLKENQFMQKQILLRYGYYLNSDETVTSLNNASAYRFPNECFDVFDDMYGKFEYPMQAAIFSMALEAFEHGMRKARATRKDAIKLALEFLRDIYPDAIIAQGKIDPNGSEEVVKVSQMNLIGAIRVIMSNDEAIDVFERIARDFGSQDPRLNPQITRVLSELACDVVNQTQFQTKFGKNPQSVLLRKEQPRNPKDRASDYLRTHNKNRRLGSAHFEVATNEDSDHGYKLGQRITFDFEKGIQKRDERDRLTRRNYLTNRYNVSGLGAAAERYMGQLNTSRLNFTGTKNRDLNNERVLLDQILGSNKNRDRLMNKYNIRAVADEPDGISFDIVTLDELTEIINQTFTNVGVQYMNDLSEKFDDEALNEYDETEDQQRVEDKIETIRAAVEEIYNSGDPDYIINGKGRRGSFEPDDVEMTRERLVNRVEWMNEDQLLDFIKSEFSDENRNVIADMMDSGSDIEDIRKIVIRYVEDNYQGESDVSEEDMQDFLEYLHNEISGMDEEGIIKFMDYYMDDNDTQDFIDMIDRRVSLPIIKRRLINLLENNYDLDQMYELVTSETENDVVDYDNKTRYPGIKSINNLSDALRADIYDVEPTEDPQVHAIMDMDKFEMANWLQGALDNPNMPDIMENLRSLTPEKFMLFKRQMVAAYVNRDSMFLDSAFENAYEHQPTRVERSISQVRGLRIDKDQYLRRKLEEDEDDETVAQHTYDLLHGRLNQNRRSNLARGY